jgi:hypothetical protein
LLVLCAKIDMMKERFAKVLLSANMSSSGKGICTMLAITNLSGTHERGHPGMPQAWRGR